MSTKYACKDCGYEYGHMIPSPLAIAGHLQREHGQHFGMGEPIAERPAGPRAPYGYTPFETALSHEEMAKVPAGKFGMIDVHTTARALNTSPENRPRIYAYIERGEFAGQIVRLHSLDKLEQHEGNIGFAWTSANTIADIIHKA